MYERAGVNRVEKKYAGMCGPNEIYDKCAGNCYSTCKEPNKLCPAICGPGACRCKTGYVRRWQGECVRWDQC
ncbi:trypsin Inhibitor like cysteine rich domain protein [Ancylostoma caninum]|uniref:Trypsin Inhibitor like cysteine rich domain protein n=1 Tax=Ancylostoma caninum TaxID=29170 RepID=A0A368HCH0_ANCCA|nr:trypsin Inhibitor like cysteine rich domain protein [Ancylostoma caninum]